MSRFITLDLGRPAIRRRVPVVLDRPVARLKSALLAVASQTREETKTHRHMASLIKSGNLRKLEEDLKEKSLDVSIIGYVLRLGPAGSSAQMIRAGAFAFLVAAGPSNEWTKESIVAGLFAAERAMSLVVRQIYGEAPKAGGLCDAVARLVDAIEKGSLDQWFVDGTKSRDSGTRAFGAMVQGFLRG